MAYQQPPWSGTMSAGAQVAQPVYANWLYRLGSYIIDSIVTGAATWLALILVGVFGLTDPNTGLSPAGTVLYLIGGLVSLVIGIWNLFIRQGRTGQSLGKQALSTRLVSAQTGEPIGAGMAFVRQLAHILDALPCYIGFLWPIWDARRQTFADKIVNTVVVRT